MVTKIYNEQHRLASLDIIVIDDYQCSTSLAPFKTGLVGQNVKYPKTR